jgi:hypothetical protein
VEKYLVSGASILSIDGVDLVTIRNGTATVGFSGARIDLDRYEADFTFYAPGVSDVFYRKQRIFVVESNGYLTRDPASSISDDPVPRAGLKIAAYPNPFNPVSTIAVDLAEAGPLRVAVYDASGRRVKLIFEGHSGAGRRIVRWNGDNEAGVPAASGVYFVRATSGGQSTSVKIALLR